MKIFAGLPSLPTTFNDLWRGQAKALSDWHAARDKQDVVISLNTGAGKTVVGLLVAQSLVNEGISNVLYACSTIDLVRQTAAEAKRIGIAHTTRVRAEFSNDLFETGKAFCITTYAALFNGLSALRRRHFPGAIILDDAHVAESLMRDAFTLTINSKDHASLFNDVVELFRPHFRDLGREGLFSDSLDLSRQSTAFVPPRGLYDRRDRLLEIFGRHGVKNNDDFKYVFAWLEDHLTACAAIFTRGVFQLAPPFLPSLAIDIFQRRVRRVYLSATLESLTDFVRAFGRRPDVVLTPDNDAGNGERFIMSGDTVSGGFGPPFATELSRRHKVLVAVPDYVRAKAWSAVAEPPSREEFSEKLDVFRRAGRGAFTLVSRVDGIDLPHDTCRVMILDGLPNGTSLLERYQWEFLHMNNVHASRIANRMAQLFGRINRGRNDYGAFLIQGDDLRKWLKTDRNLALLPPLLRQQIDIGREVQSEFNIRSATEANNLIDRILNRDPDWLDYYKREISSSELDEEAMERHRASEPSLVEAAITEAKYAAAIWNGDYSVARREIEKTIDATAEFDTPLGGWHSLWLGAAYDLEGDGQSAGLAYGQAMRRLGTGIVLPRPSGSAETSKPAKLNPFGSWLGDFLGQGYGSRFDDLLSQLKKTLALIDEGTPRQAEAGVRQLGEMLGFAATRPDNDAGTGPDVVWRSNGEQFGFELKTDKRQEPITYTKRDIGQGHDHLEWMSNNHEEEILGLAFVGRPGIVESRANPSKDMSLCELNALVALRSEVLALVDDLRRKAPIERMAAIVAESERRRWEMKEVLDRLRLKPLSSE